MYGDEDYQKITTSVLNADFLFSDIIHRMAAKGIPIILIPSEPHSLFDYRFYYTNKISEDDYNEWVTDDRPSDALFDGFLTEIYRILKNHENI